MITGFHIENFKSLLDFQLPPEGALNPFTCLVGLNGSGKSTLLQAFDFIAHISTGKLEEWLEERDWKRGDLICNIGPASRSISFDVRLKLRDDEDLVWSGRLNCDLLKCFDERISVFAPNVSEALLYQNRNLVVLKKDAAHSIKLEKVFEYSGSILSQLKLSDFDPRIERVKETLQSLKSLELLSPQSMRKRAKHADDIGIGGEKLSAFLSTLNRDQMEKLAIQIKAFYPSTFEGLEVSSMRAGWKNLRILEKYGIKAIESTHINDGLLRIIAILAQAQSSHDILLFDEIENGINPALVEKLVDFLVALGKKGKQVIVTTHSPMILNYLEDSVAKESVLMLYRNREGQTKCCRYFDQPETREKLEVLGPGEVFADTDLQAMAARLSREQPAGVIA